MRPLPAAPLEIRLASAVGLILLLFALVAGAFTYYNAYRHEVAEARSLQQQLVRTVQAQAEVSVYARNTAIAEGVTEGLLANPIILAVRVESADGFHVESARWRPVRFDAAREFPLYSPVDSSERVGTLWLLQNDEEVARAAVGAAVLHTGLMLLEVLIAAVLLVVVLRLMIVKPITRLAHALSGLQPGSADRLPPDVVARGDEIGLLARHANTLLEAAEAAIDEVTTQHHELERLATHDQLTGLPTMRLAEDRLQVACTMAQRGGDKVALLFVDLDGFKTINDTYGHQAGDDVLKQVAERLNRCIRAQDTAARLGGDEFLVILGGLSDAQAASRIASEINRAMAAPMAAAGQVVTLGASIGIALFPDHADNIKDMRHLADEAMYAVKKAGKGTFAYARPMRRRTAS